MKKDKTKKKKSLSSFADKTISKNENNNLKGGAYDLIEAPINAGKTAG